MIRIVRLHFKNENIEEFKNLFEERKEKIRNFPGCSYLELWQDEEDKARHSGEIVGKLVNGVIKYF